MIKPSLRRGWCDRQTVRYGVTPAHSVLFGPLDGATETFLTLLDGTRSLRALRGEARALGLRARAADRITGRLRAAGVLADATQEGAASADVGDALRPDLASLSLVHPAPGEGARRLLARRTARVQVRGAGRVGAAVAAALSQAGVGEVEVVDGGEVEVVDSSPGGLRREHVGQRRAAAARSVVRSVLPWRRGSGAQRGEGAHLVIFAPRDGLAAYAPDPLLAEPVLAAGTPHLYAGVVEATGFVGPLVLPGATGCAGCLLRTRARREPAWPLLVAQWRNGRRRGVAACDGPLAMAVAGLTACTALAFLDGAPRAGGGVRLELALPDLVPTSHPVEPHEECPCGAAGVLPEVGGAPGDGPAGPVRAGRVHNDA
ncbi:ThiF family adenylyltransferase [Streptomyces avicenniae]|uniref:ThiF family adenylyltransferase n=1 Tax=Streptomyces avicenniae TaxID=500153 RepID=UPI00069C88F9|nr:ThiF family adenylyltransferase [Streptomyces avicenniae]